LIKLFQSLIGELKTVDIYKGKFTYKEFQSLIGELKTDTGTFTDGESIDSFNPS